MKFQFQNGLRPLIAVVLFAALSAPRFCHAQASFQGLGDLPNGKNPHSQAYGVSGDGNIVVGYSVSLIGNEAFRWDQVNGMQGLGGLQSGFGSESFGISQHGSFIVGKGFKKPSKGNPLVEEAFVWDSANGMTGLGALVSGGLGDVVSVATAASADGSFVVGKSGDGKKGNQAFIWNATDGMQGLGFLSTYDISSAEDVSADGTVVVGSSISPISEWEAFLWTASSGMQGLGLLPGGTSSQATAVSSDGNVVVGFGDSTAYAGEAFFWTASGGMQGLGFSGSPAAVTADGSVVVGHSFSTATGDEAFIWDATNEMRQLKNALIVDYGIPASELAGWTLTHPTDISDDGRVIVGYGVRKAPNGTRIEAWRVDLGPANTGPTVSCPSSQTEECVGGGAEFTIQADVFDADGDDLSVEWHITYPDGSSDMINDIVTFGDPPTPTTITLGGGPFFFPHGVSSVNLCVSDGTADAHCCSPISLTVDDTRAPIVISMIEYIEVPTDPGECFATVDLNSPPYAPVFSDLCDPGFTATNDAPPLFQLEDSPVIVTWTVTDDSGNQLTAWQTVSVSDQEAPTGTPPDDVVIGHDYGVSHATNVDLGTPDVSDNCEVVSMINNAPATFFMGETVVQWFVSDAAGNTIVLEQLVTVTNEAPVADAAMEQLTDIGSLALLRLDATGSSDADHPFEHLTFDWVIENLDTGDIIYRSGPIIEQFLDYGDYWIMLHAVDPEGARGEVIKTISLNPADLSSFNLECVKVFWFGNCSRAFVTGEIGLPAGVDHSELFPMAVIHANLGGQNILNLEPVITTTGGHDGHHWRYHNHHVTNGVHTFAVHWRGARYNYSRHGFPVRINSDAISSQQTVLAIRLTKKKIDAPFSIDFDGQATVDFDADGNVIGSTVEYDEEKPGQLVSVTLPFPLLDSSTIEFSGGLTRQLDVGDDLQESVGRFLMDIRFDGSAFPDEEDKLPRTLDMEIYVGDQLYPGTSSLTEEDLNVWWRLWYFR